MTAGNRKNPYRVTNEYQDHLARRRKNTENLHIIAMFLLLVLLASFIFYVRMNPA